MSGKSLSLTAITRSLLFYALPASYTFCTSITLFPTFTLDVGSYHFEETKAPEGYSINTDGKTLTLTVNGDVATAKLYNEGQLNDTKLSALPSTGGIGTTIFTIAGCVIMIAAAGLFFASRKKSDNK